VRRVTEIEDVCRVAEIGDVRRVTEIEDVCRVAEIEDVRRESAVSDYKKAKDEAYTRRIRIYSHSDSIWNVDHDIAEGISYMKGDPDGYPLAPTGDVIFGRVDASKSPNLQNKFSYWQMNVVKQSKPGSDVEWWRKHCCGVLTCQNDSCEFTICPKQNHKDLIKVLHDEHAGGKAWKCVVCNGQMLYQSCSAVVEHNHILYINNSSENLIWKWQTFA
jgi:hypothetical protein